MTVAARDDVLMDRIREAGQAVQADLMLLADTIRQTRADIARLRPDDIRTRDIPAVTDELDAVVGATETATGSILDACEALERLAGDLDAAPATAVIDEVTRIYEACNFQDITGQRITKVVRTLKVIEGKVGEMLAALGCDAEPGGCEPGDREPDGPAAPAPVDHDGGASLLNGPQLPGNGSSQDDVDRLLAGGD